MDCSPDNPLLSPENHPTVPPAVLLGDRRNSSSTPHDPGGAFMKHTFPAFLLLALAVAVLFSVVAAVIAFALARWEELRCRRPCPAAASRSPRASPCAWPSSRRWTGRSGGETGDRRTTGLSQHALRPRAGLARSCPHTVTPAGHTMGSGGVKAPRARHIGSCRSRTARRRCHVVVAFNRPRAAKAPLGAGSTCVKCRMGRVSSRP